MVVPSLESARHVAEQSDDAFEGPVDAVDDLVCRCETDQKHFTRQELRRALVSRGMKVLNLRRIHYPWIDDGLDTTSAKPPWDWVCLARKPQADFEG